MSYIAFCLIFDGLFGKIDTYEQGRSNTARNDYWPRHQHRTGGVGQQDSAMVEIIDYYESGIIEKVCTNIHQHRPRKEEEVAQQQSQNQSRHTAVEVAMRQSENHGRHNDSHVLVAKPVAQNLLQRAAEKEFLAHSGNQRHNYELQHQVAYTGEREHTLNTRFRFIGHPAEGHLTRPQIPMVVPPREPVVERHHQHKYHHRDKSQKPLSSTEVETVEGGRIALVKPGESQRGQQKHEQLRAALCQQFGPDSGWRDSSDGDKHKQTRGEDESYHKKKEQAHQLMERLGIAKKD